MNTTRMFFNLKSLVEFAEYVNRFYKCRNKETKRNAISLSFCGLNLLGIPIQRGFTM